MEKLNLKSIYSRLKSDTPVFWKQIRKIMIGCTTLGGGLAALPADRMTFMPYSLPAILMAIGACGIALATMTSEDKEKPGDISPGN